MPGTEMAERDRVQTVLTSHRVGDELGHGACGRVYAARHRLLNRPDAVKVLRGSADADLARRFRDEARVLATLSHPHLVKIYDYIERDGLALIVMEELPNGTLARRAAAGALPHATTCGIGLAVASALTHAHARKVLHRDLKPANLLFDVSDVLKVTDFGIAKILEGASATATSIAGTPAYMAPEQLTGGRLSPATDVYALGAVLYELMTGRAPFGPDLARDDRDGAPALPGGVPGPIADVVRHMLRPRPADRYADAHRLAVELARAAARALGAAWLSSCDLPLHLDDDVRDAARTATGRPVWPGRWSPKPAPAGPDGPAAGPAGREGRRVTSPAVGPAPAPTAAAVTPRQTPSPRPTRPPIWWGSVAKETKRLPAPSSPRVVSALLERPYGIAVDGAGNLYLTHHLDHRISLLTAEGRVRAILGTGRAGYGGDGAQAEQALFDSPRGIAVAADGTIFIADTFNHRVRSIATTGLITTIIGGEPPDRDPSASLQPLSQPDGVAVDAAGAVYVADTGNNRVLVRAPDGRVNVVAGTGVSGFSGDGGPARRAHLNAPRAVAVDSRGMLYIADTGNNRVRTVDPAGRIATVVGLSWGGTIPEGGPALRAHIGAPHGVAVSADGTLVVSDPHQHQVWRVDPAGRIHAVRGRWTSTSRRPGRTGRPGDGPTSPWTSPTAVALGPEDALYVTDPSMQRVWRVRDGRLATVIGPALPDSNTSTPRSQT